MTAKLVMLVIVSAIPSIHHSARHGEADNGRMVLKVYQNGLERVRDHLSRCLMRNFVRSEFVVHILKTSVPRNAKSTASFVSKGMEMPCECIMERTELLKQLEQVEQQISDTTELIARQRKILVELDRKEVDNDAIQIMLIGLENLLVAHLREREKLRADLAELEGGSSQEPQPSDC